MQGASTLKLSMPILHGKQPPWCLDQLPASAGDPRSREAITMGAANLACRQMSQLSVPGLAFDQPGRRPDVNIQAGVGSRVRTPQHHNT